MQSDTPGFSNQQILPYILGLLYMEVATHKRMDAWFTFCSFPSYQDNVSPLHVASQEGHNDVVQTLLEAGADVNTATFAVSNVMFSYVMP